MARISELTIENEAESLRDTFNLSNRLPVDIQGLLLQQSILSVFTPLSDGFSGMCLKYKAGTNFILVNSNMSLGRQRFTISHELYHLFVQNANEFKVHSCNINNPDSPIERHANNFASLFLLPYSGVSEMMRKMKCSKVNINPAHIIEMCEYFGVSYKAMLIRVEKILNLEKGQSELLDVISPVKSAKGYGLPYDVFEIPQIKNRVLGDYAAIAQSLYDSGKISKGHLIELLSDIKFD